MERRARVQYVPARDLWCRHDSISGLSFEALEVVRPALKCEQAWLRVVVEQGRPIVPGLGPE